MRIEQIFHLDDNDKYLLSNPIPDNPCSKCAAEHKSCCGCSSYDTYSQKLKPYMEANILEFAQEFKKLNKINSEIAALKEKFTEIYSSLPPEIKKIYDTI